MAKESAYGASETGNWNVASRFAEVKIMLPLEKCDFYEDVAKFGYHSYLDELVNYGIPTDVLRITALNRLVEELIKIAKNSMFAMKTKGTKDNLKGMVDKLVNVKKTFPKLSKINKIRRSSVVTIKQEDFSNVLEVVLEIKSEINEPLNRNHLIFTDREEFDPKAAKAQIKGELKEKG